MTRPTIARLTRTVKESHHETSALMMPEHANNLGHVFGGVVLGLMDKAAAVTAIRHARSTCVTEIGVRVEAEDLQSGARRHTNSCYLTFVAVDRNGRPIEVPDLKPESPEEIRRFHAAVERRRRRLEEREQERQTREHHT
jgi:acyl-CoA hydrolase